MARILQSRTQQKCCPSKIILWIAAGALVLCVGLTIYAIRPSPTEIISPIPSPSLIPPISPTTRMISYVHDGDTIYTRGSKPAIRLLGIDAPEMAGSYRCGADADCTGTVEECGASEAKEKLRELVLKKEVWLVDDETVGAVDKYNRALRYIFVRREINTIPCVTENESCLDINLELIRLGAVHESGFGNAYQKQNVYRQAETEAKRKKLGIWGTCP